MDLLLHDIPEAVDAALRRQAKATGTTVDLVAADVLSRALGVAGAAGDPPFHDLDWFLGSGRLDDATLAALAECDIVHPEQDHKVDEFLADEQRRAVASEQ